MGSGGTALRPVALLATAALIAGLGLGCAPGPDASPPDRPADSPTAAPRTSAPTAASRTSPSPTPQAEARITLPKPTGDHAVGRTEIALTDNDRKDPWEPQSGPRRVLLSLFYPATAPSDRLSAYMSAAESQAVISRQRQLGVKFDADVTDDVLRDVRTHATVDADPADGEFPLVLLSPGFNLTRKTLTGLATELASQGYVVALMGHNYETGVTEFPDGEVTGCSACSGDIVDVPRVRAKDATFVLDQLLGDDSPWTHASMINPDKIAIGGHSMAAMRR